ncbi:MAG: FAD-dependent oxidoreductase [Planctomycetes bacterium]|nr:FAD-dependent oxidoreductase [Planctomycetota bacterium]
MSAQVAVIGGGVAGCAAAVAAADAGARVVLIVRDRFLGGAAVRGEHRTLCGLAPIDAPVPVLLEPELVGAWLPLVTVAQPERHGRVWLWPTRSEVMRTGLAQRVGAAGIDLRLGASVSALALDGERIAAVTVDGMPIAVDSVIDASGSGLVARLTGGIGEGVRQWPAYRAELALDLAAGPAARVRALALARTAIGSDAATSLSPIAPGRWQLSVDLRPGSSTLMAAELVERIADRLGATVLAMAVCVAERDEGRPRGSLTLAELFAQRERNLCWAAWPGEAHGPDGTTWTWPDADRHGVPLSAVRTADTPANCWYVGKGVPVAHDAASALRVTGTCLALGAAVGHIAAGSEH